MSKCLMCIIVICLSNMGCIAGNDKYHVKGVDDGIYYSLSGVWDWFTSANVNTVEMDFSWGKGKIVVNGSIVIELGSPTPYFGTGGVGNLDILSIQEIEKNVFKLTCEWKRGEKGYFVIHLNDDGTIWLEDYFPPHFLWKTGPENVYHRRSGPLRDNIS